MARYVLHIAVAVALLAGSTHSAPAAAADSGADDLPTADYLALLEQISPAAQAGARAYLQAVQHRCRRSLPTAELRRAMSEGDGDPVLMAMIRASHLRDTAALGRLGDRVTCEQRGAR